MEKFNLRKLSERMQVSRRSVRNDIEVLQEELKEPGIVLAYDKKYQLLCEPEQLYVSQSREMEKYVGLFAAQMPQNAYERKIFHMVQEMVAPAEPGEKDKEHVISIIKEEMGYKEVRMPKKYHKKQSAG